MADPREFVAPLIPSLLPVPAVQPGVCVVCRSSCSTGYPRCPQCQSALRSFGTLPDVLPIALVTSESPLYESLRGYKNLPLPSSARVRHARTVAALLATFLHFHAHCVTAFDSATAIPSMNRTAVREVIDHVGVLRNRYSPSIEPARSWDQRELAADRYRPTRDVTNERILVLDDTFTSGATAFSACEALRRAGAIVVGPVVIGRFLRLEYEPSRLLQAQLAKHSWQETECIRCSGGVQVSDGRLL